MVAVMLRLMLILGCGVPAVTAGTVQGMILEFGSGLPLARARVYLELVDGTGVRRVASLYTQRGGQFSFGAQPDGLYLVSGERESYSLAFHGARRPEGFGVPFAVTKDSSQFVELRLHKLGVITGTVRDENGVGLPGIRVLAYPRRLPLRTVANATSDDRGVYRLLGLTPGKYWVRTAGHVFGESGEGIVPTFAPELTSSQGAKVFEARLDVEVAYADVRPLAGRQGSVQGSIAPCPLEGPVQVTLSTEEGNRTVTTACGGAFAFENVSEGPKEISALHSAACLGYFEDIAAAGDKVLQLQPCGPVRFERSPAAAGPLLVRRRDYAGTGPLVEVKGNGPIELAPGYWEVLARWPATHYLADVRSRFYNRARGHGPEWFQFMAQPRTGQGVTLVVGESAASMGGVVTREGQGVPAAPVFLWPVTEAARRSLGGARVVRTDGAGRFSFAGLAPGDYRLMSSYDFREVDEDAMLVAAPTVIRLGAGQAEKVELTIFETR